MLSLTSIDLSINNYQSDFYKALNIFDDKKFSLKLASNIKNLKLSNYWFDILNIFNLLESLNIDVVCKKY